jgi:hypothetical protein
LETLIDAEEATKADIEAYRGACAAIERATCPPVSAATGLPTPFDDYEIHGVRRIDAISGQEESKGQVIAGHYDQVDDSEAEFWSLFGHIPGQGLDCIGDFTSRELAEEIFARITGRRYEEKGNHTMGDL